jgi:RNA polymerase sigma-70 factor, ECF subfamily
LAAPVTRWWNCTSGMSGSPVLGLKPETVRTRLHRARRMLRNRLGEQFAAVLKDVFPFERPRCDALVRKLLIEIGSIRMKRT